MCQWKQESDKLPPTMGGRQIEATHVLFLAAQVAHVRLEAPVDREVIGGLVAQVPLAREKERSGERGWRGGS